ncbi:hypothetical protein V8G54_034886 [Vigna mungo]|uniref:Integrase catalytic domain-containing protein n=1 Tax=Vigna mungo TaxID=3915 RepID=A0AAQ3ME45_VIGMU
MAYRVVDALEEETLVEENRIEEEIKVVAWKADAWAKVIHSLFAKRSKCYFGVTRVEYLGHFISVEGVTTDPAKIIVIQQWPLPQSVKQLRGFLGLAGYYRRFKWRHYLLPKKFTIITDHQSLKYILDQRLSTTFQQKWLVKLMEFDFDIEYKQGRENIAFRASACSGHSGRGSTFYRANFAVYWKDMTNDIKKFKNKYDTTASLGLLQPLPVPDHVWQHINMDFIEGLPNSIGKQVIFVVMDRLSKVAHFMALQHPYTTAGVAQCYLDNFFKLHGCPATITSDRDPIFVSQFWKEFMVVQGVQTQLSTTYHPQIDDACAVMNLNNGPNGFHWPNGGIIQLSTTPPMHLPYLPGESKVELIDRSLQKREEILKLAKMKQLANKHGSKREFKMGDLVFVKLHPYKQILLKKSVGNAHTSTNYLATEDEAVHRELEVIIDRTIVKRGNNAITKALVKCKKQLPEDATWEFY